MAGMLVPGLRKEKDLVCLNNDLCAGIVLGAISNVDQAASPVLTEAPDSVSTPQHSAPTTSPSPSSPRMKGGVLARLGAC